MAKVKEVIVAREYDPNAWMVTFSDLLNLLLTFFVMLLTMKSMDTQKFREFFGQLVPSLGVFAQGGSTDLVQPSIVPTVEEAAPAGTGDKEIATSNEAYLELLKLLAMINNSDRLITVEVTDAGIVVRFRADLAFEADSAQLRPEAVQVLARLVPVFSRVEIPMRVEGHTAAPEGDSGDLRAQMDLSLRRADAVLQALLAQPEMAEAAGRFTVVGRGAQAPRTFMDNERVDPADPRQRRVEIIIETRIQAVTL
jgi:chemotaxis protein MotB